MLKAHDVRVRINPAKDETGGDLLDLIFYSIGVSNQVQVTAEAAMLLLANLGKALAEREGTARAIRDHKKERNAAWATRPSPSPEKKRS